MLDKIKNTLLAVLSLFLFCNCDKEEIPPTNKDEIKGFSLLNKLTGHWIGSNQTAFGDFDWFAFDFRPISPSHLHSIGRNWDLSPCMKINRRFVNL